MKRQYHISLPGIVLISPNAKYCQLQAKGDVFQDFLNAAFEESLKTGNEVIFRVGGLFSAINQLSFRKIRDGVGLELISNEVHSGREAYKYGRQVSMDWFMVHRPGIANLLIQQIEKLAPQQQSIRISLYGPNGIDHYPLLKLDRFNSNSASRTVSIRVDDVEEEWLNKDFVKKIAVVIAQFEKGRALFQEKGEIIDCFSEGSDKESFETNEIPDKFTRNAIALKTLPAFTSQDHQRLCDALFPTDKREEFESALHSDQSDNIPAEKLKEVFIRMSSAALVYFDKKTKDAVSTQDKAASPTVVEQVFKNDIQYLLAELAAFMLFPEDKNLLYPAPDQMNFIQQQITICAKILSGADLKFTVTYNNVLPEKAPKPTKHTKRPGSPDSNNSSETKAFVDKKDKKKPRLVESSSNEGSLSDVVSTTSSSSSESLSDEDERPKEATAKASPPPGSDAGNSNSSDEEVREAFQKLRDLNKTAVARETPYNAYATLQLLYKFIEWHRMALGKASCQTNTKQYVEQETAFWLAVLSVSNHFEEKIEKEKNKLSLVLTQWVTKVKEKADEFAKKPVMESSAAIIARMAALRGVLGEDTNPTDASSILQALNAPAAYKGTDTDIHKADSKSDFAAKVSDAQSAIRALDDQDLDANTEAQTRTFFEVLISAVQHFDTRIKDKNTTLKIK